MNANKPRMADVVITSVWKCTAAEHRACIARERAEKRTLVSNVATSLAVGIVGGWLAMVIMWMVK